MIKTILSLALLAAAAPALAIQTASPPPPVPAQVRSLQQSALKDDYAWDITEGLSTEVGPRLAGTAAEARAREWAVAKLRAMGFANVRVETFPLTVWTRDLTTESAFVVAPLPAAIGGGRARQ